MKERLDADVCGVEEVAVDCIAVDIARALSKVGKSSSSLLSEMRVCSPSRSVFPLYSLVAPHMVSHNITPFEWAPFVLQTWPRSLLVDSLRSLSLVTATL